ncbi:hypothetical protein DDN60_15405 [Vibrio cholerae]|nr:hypothetical protein [Vibrio cholerae]
MKLKLSAALILIATSCPTYAIYIAPLKVEQTQVLDQSTGNSQYTYKVDGIEIELSEKDKHRAKNWNLTDSDWAKYKYLMEYTPRGLWTPDLDPPLALGNASQTESDREYYIRIQNQIEKQRIAADEAMTSTTNRIEMVGQYSRQQKMSPLRAQLNQSKENQSQPKDTLRSIFVDLKACDSECKTFITLAVASSSSSTQLDMHFTGGDESDSRKFLNQIGINENKMNSKGININASYMNESVLKFKGNGSLPFYLNKTEEGTTRHSM